MSVCWFPWWAFLFGYELFRQTSPIKQSVCGTGIWDRNRITYCLWFGTDPFIVFTNSHVPPISWSLAYFYAFNFLNQKSNSFLQKSYWFLNFQSGRPAQPIEIGNKSRRTESEGINALIDGNQTWSLNSDLRKRENKFQHFASTASTWPIIPFAS